MRAAIRWALLVSVYAAVTTSTWGDMSRGGLEPVSLPPDPTTLTADRAPAIVSVRLEDDVEIVVDGKLDEDVWGQLPGYGDFRVVSPDTMAPTRLGTQVKFFYTATGFYLSANMEQAPETLVERMSSRDQWHSRDSFIFYLDTSGEGRYGFWFSLSLGGSMGDGTILPERHMSTNWDGAWHGATSRTETGWVAEFHVPWSLVSMPKAAGDRAMGLLATRRVAHLNEMWSWPALPMSRPKFLSEFQELALNGVDLRQQYSVYPYVSSVLDNLDGEVVTDAGVDLFWRPSTNFQVTATLNPDFGDVETDDVIVNLTAFETFYPEKRLFFQEGQEVFRTGTRSSYSYGSSAPRTLVLHTRRIGGRPLRPDVPAGVTLSPAEHGRPTELLGAVKATGQRDQLRFGLLFAGEDETRFEGLSSTGEREQLRQDGRHYGVARLLWEGGDSDSRALGWMSTVTRRTGGDAVVHAVDGHAMTTSGRWEVDGELITSSVPGAEAGYGGLLDIKFAPFPGLTHTLSMDHYDGNLDIDDLGYLRRNDLTRYQYQARLSRSDLAWTSQSRTWFALSRGYNRAGERVVGSVEVSQDVRLTDLSRARVRATWFPARFEDRNGFGNGSYRVEEAWDLRLRYESNDTLPFSYKLEAEWGQEDLGGPRRTWGGGITWRPAERMAMEFGVDYVERDGWVLHREAKRFALFGADEWAPKFSLDYFITGKQQFRMALQWAAVRAGDARFYDLAPSRVLVPASVDGDPGSADFSVSELSFQIRYRWEIAPMSDLFFVYTKHADLPNGAGEDLNSMLTEAFENPVAEQLALKLRYRLGS
ncbi:MAG: DUF5916 domain-containing protein [Gammaproteobacteria bacterium]|nr:DUF5916 domain-containing protein [Gammaproteobacteria bacterium]MDE0450266.1 DUF5916 domain-containing protein [Gammaproteobacteria bacterium]